MNTEKKSGSNESKLPGGTIRWIIQSATFMVLIAICLFFASGRLDWVMTLLLITTPIILESSWAFIPAVINIATIILRTTLEDRTLQKELDGYADYAQQVHRRLLPGVW